MTQQALRIGVIGLGTVGQGVLRVLQEDKGLIAQKAGRGIVVKGVCAKTKNKPRTVSVADYEWFDDPLKLATHADIDAVLELIGGAEGIPRAVCEAALKAGKAVITANKSLLCAHGPDIAKLAIDKNVPLGYEAAVGGGIPIIKTMREALTANDVTEIRAVLNGTCNYILTQMRRRKITFTEALKEAQEKGYAESDPSLDVNGDDTGHKLTILTALAFGVHRRGKDLPVTGITGLSPTDLEMAEELGYRLRLLGVARQAAGELEQFVGPCMVPLNSPLAIIDDVENGILLHGDRVGRLLLMGRGAGAEPTASAVVADIIDLATGRLMPSLAHSLLGGRAMPLANASQLKAQYYLRLSVKDQPGVVAEIGAILRDQKISIHSLVQRGETRDGIVPVVLITHATAMVNMQTAMAQLEGSGSIVASPCLIRLEK